MYRKTKKKLKKLFISTEFKVTTFTVSTDCQFINTH